MISVNEIEMIIKEQEKRMQNLLNDEKIIKRELIIPQEKIIKGVANIIMGPRRCGKSVLAFMLANGLKFGYINFDDERLTIQANELNKVIEAIYLLKGDVEIFVFDEIQEVSGWEKFASRLTAFNRLILTGSNARMLSMEMSTYMTGRHIDHTLFPFSFREFLDYNGVEYNDKTPYTTEEKAKIISMLRRYIDIGGFPLAIKAGKEFLSDLYRDIVERDVIQRYKIRMTLKLTEMARYILSNSSSEISYSKLRNIFGIASKHTVQDWLNYLEKAYLIFKIERFSFKLKKSIIAPKKVYGIDTGLVSLVSLNSDIPKLMENAVAIELIRRKYYWEYNKEINYWKDHSQREVDFIIRNGNNVFSLIQVTYASKIDEIKDREINAIINASDELKCNNLFIITWDYDSTEIFKSKKIIFISLWKWLLER